MKLLFVLVLMFIALIALQNLLRRSSGSPADRYRRTQPFLSKAERSFFGVLQQAAGTDVVVFAKVRVADVLTPEKSTRQTWQSAFNRISAKHFDFLVCDAKEVSPLLAIELDDASHGQAKRIRRDEFLDGACASAGLPLLRIPAKRAYSIHELRERIGVSATRAETSGARSSSQARIEPTIDPPPVQQTGPAESAQAPVCPRCAGPVKRQTGQSGALSGIEYWQCEKAPQCAGVLPIRVPRVN